MAQYGAPWQALLQSDTQPVDTNRNPDFDRLMGFSEDPNDSGAVAFTKALQSSMTRNSPQGREMTMEIMKAKLANQTQLELYKQKLALEHQYPDYISHATPWGSNLLIDKNSGDTKEVGLEPGMKETYMARQQAELAKAKEESDPDVIGARKQSALLAPALTQSTINANNAKPAMDAAVIGQRNAEAELARVRAAGGGGSQHLKYPSLKEALEDAARLETGMSDKQLIDLQVMGDPSLKDRINKRAQGLYDQQFQGRKPQQSAPGLAAPQPPDLSSLTAPLSDDE
jgi:hypothetical protein